MALLHLWHQLRSQVFSVLSSQHISRKQSKTKMKFFLLLACALVYVSAKPRIIKRQAIPPAPEIPAPELPAPELPSNASFILGGSFRRGFDCTGLEYGYYADPENNCHIFHVCLPYTSSAGVETTRKFSFLCGVGTIFDQAQLVCNYPEYSYPCAEAQNLYNINDYFREENVGRKFRDGLNDIY